MSKCKKSRVEIEREDLQKEELLYVENFSKHYCTICKKKIRVCCGTPVVHTGGCCVGIHSKVSKSRYIRGLKTHMRCFYKTIEQKQKTLKKVEQKLNWEIEEIREIIDGDK